MKLWMADYKPPKNLWRDQIMEVVSGNAHFMLEDEIDLAQHLDPTFPRNFDMEKCVEKMIKVWDADRKLIELGKLLNLAQKGNFMRYRIDLSK